MKKLIALTTTLGLLTAQTAIAATPLNIPAPTGGVPPATNIGTVISSIITIIIIVATIAVLFMLVFGAFEWITSGGDKDAVNKARGRIINALIGLVIIALAFLIVRVVGNIVGIDILNTSIPTLWGT